MDAPTWFKSVPVNPPAARSRQAAAPGDDDEDWEEWDAVIRRAKVQAASP